MTGMCCNILSHVHIQFNLHLPEGFFKFLLMAALRPLQIYWERLFCVKYELGRLSNWHYKSHTLRESKNDASVAAGH